VTLSGGGAPTVSDTDQISFGGAQPDFDLVSGSYEADIFEQAFPFGERSRQAGDHPFEERVNFDLNAKSGISRRMEPAKLSRSACSARLS
jgi:hypothetical protein